MIDTPNTLFPGDVPDVSAAEMAIGIVNWRPDRCIDPVRFARDPVRIADNILAQFP